MKKTILLFSLLILIITIGCEKLPDLGNGYKIVKNRSIDLGIVKSKKSYILRGHILDYAFDSIFIIAVQKPRERFPDMVDESSLLSDEEFRNSKVRQYWIINKKHESEFIIRTRTYSNVYGPYNKETFLLKRKELGVPDNLKFENKE